jgi:hypothetical protein
LETVSHLVQNGNKVKKCSSYYKHDRTKFKKKVEYLNHDDQIQVLLDQKDVESGKSGTLTINQKHSTPWTRRHNQVQ